MWNYVTSILLATCRLGMDAAVTDQYKGVELQKLVMEYRKDGWPYYLSDLKSRLEAPRDRNAGVDLMAVAKMAIPNRDAKAENKQQITFSGKVLEVKAITTLHKILITKKPLYLDNYLSTLPCRQPEGLTKGVELVALVSSAARYYLARRDVVEAEILIRDGFALAKLLSRTHLLPFWLRSIGAEHIMLKSCRECEVEARRLKLGSLHLSAIVAQASFVPGLLDKLPAEAYIDVLCAENSKTLGDLQGISRVLSEGCGGRSYRLRTGKLPLDEKSRRVLTAVLTYWIAFAKDFPEGAGRYTDPKSVLTKLQQLDSSPKFKIYFSSFHPSGFVPNALRYLEALKVEINYTKKLLKARVE